MSGRTEQYSVRLSVVDGKIAKAELRSFGAEGDAAFKKIELSSQGAKAAMTEMQAFLLRRLVPAFAGLNLGRDLIQNIQTFELIDARLKRLSKSTDDYARIQDYLREKSNELNIGIETLAGSYANLLALENSGILNRGDVNALAEGFANVKAALGVGDQQIDQVLYGLSQVLSQGTVQAQELNQVIEPIPGFLNEIARAAGVATPQAFREMVKSGEVSSAAMKGYVQTALQAYEGAAAGISDTSVAALTRLNNAWIELSRSVGESGFTGAMATTIDAIGDVVRIMDQAAYGAYGFAEATGFLEKTTVVAVKAMGVAWNALQISVVAAADATLGSVQFVLDGFRNNLNALPGINIPQFPGLQNVRNSLQAAGRSDADQLAESLDFGAAGGSLREVQAAKAQFEQLRRSRDDIVSTSPAAAAAAGTMLPKLVPDGEVEKLKALTAVLKEAQTPLQQFGEAADDTNAQLQNIAVSGLRTMEDALVDFSLGTKSAADAFSDFAESVLRDLIRMQVQQNITGPLSGFLNSALGAGGFAVASGNSGAAFRAAANPGLFGPGFASGGSFMVGGDGGTDTTPVSFWASRGERVTVETPGQQKAAGAPTVIVNNYSSARAETRQGGPGQPVEVIVRDQVSRMIRGGDFDSSMSGRFGISPKTGR